MLTKFLLSGGAANLDPIKSIGGLPSNKEVSSSIDGLFKRISKAEAKTGSILYRCIYVLNSSQEFTLDDLTVWIENDDILPSSIKIGIPVQNEIQKIKITEYPVGGTFALTYTGTVNGTLVSQTTNDIQWTPDLTVASSNIADALNALDLLGGVSVVGSRPKKDRWEYLVTFGGINGNRNHLPLEVANNNLLGDPPQVIISTIQNGMPINAVTPNIGFDNQPPFKINFTEPKTFLEGILVGNLEPLDIFGIWLKRTCPAGTVGEVDLVDKLTINIQTKVLVS